MLKKHLKYFFKIKINKIIHFYCFVDIFSASPPPGIDMFIAFNVCVNFFVLAAAATGVALVVVVIYDANDTQTGIVFPAPHANAQLALMVIKLWQFVCVAQATKKKEADKKYIGEEPCLWCLFKTCCQTICVKYFSSCLSCFGTLAKAKRLAEFHAPANGSAE